MAISEVTEWWDRYGAKVKYNKINEMIQTINKVGMLGSANRAWVPLIMGRESGGTHQWRFGDYRYANVSSTNTNVFFLLPLPVEKNGLDLYLDAVRLDLADADSNDKIIYLQVAKLSNTSQSTVYGDSTHRQAPGTYDMTFTANKIPTYRAVLVYVETNVSTPQELSLLIYLRCYYDDV